MTIIFTIEKQFSMNLRKLQNENDAIFYNDSILQFTIWCGFALQMCGGRHYTIDITLLIKTFALSS